MKLDIKRVYSRVLEEIERIDPLLLVDVCADLYTDSTFSEDFGEFLSEVQPEAYGAPAGMAVILQTILTRRSGWHRLLNRIISRVKQYIESSRYLEMSDEELKREFDLDLPVAQLGRGVTPELLIFYIIAVKRQFRHPRLPFLIAEYQKTAEKARKAHERFSATPSVRLEGKLNGSLLEAQLNCYLDDGFQPRDDDYVAALAEKFRGTYDPRSKTVTVPRGLVAFLYAHIEGIAQAEEFFRHAQEVLVHWSRTISRTLQRAAQVFRQQEELQRHVKNLEARIRELEKENSVLKAARKQDAGDLVAKLSRKLESAQKRIAHLEAQIAALEEEREIVEEIQEQPEIVPEKPTLRKVEIPPFSRIVVSGGRYSSSDEEEIEQLLWPLGCEVTFVPADQTIRRQDLIKNADLVFFDTSRHAHKLFDKVKSLNPTVLLVSGKRDLVALLKSSVEPTGSSEAVPSG